MKSVVFSLIGDSCWDEVFKILKTVDWMWIILCLIFFKMMHIPTPHSGKTNASEKSVQYLSPIKTDQPDLVTIMKLVHISIQESHPQGPTTLFSSFHSATKPITHFCVYLYIYKEQ